jgi:hypothetical protein
MDEDLLIAGDDLLGEKLGHLFLNHSLQQKMLFAIVELLGRKDRQVILIEAIFLVSCQIIDQRGPFVIRYLELMLGELALKLRIIWATPQSANPFLNIGNFFNDILELGIPCFCGLKERVELHRALPLQSIDDVISQSSLSLLSFEVVLNVALTEEQPFFLVKETITVNQGGNEL